MIRLAVRVRAESAELVLAELLELVPSGVEESQIDDDTVEYAVYGAPGEVPELPALRAAAKDALVEISTSEIADDWSDRWRGFHRPVRIEAPAPARARRSPRSRPAHVPDLRVRPPWEPAQRPRAELAEIVIDPGLAFGTGAHATTRLCLELLLELASLKERPAALLDVGTGTGVLAIAASKLGFAPVLALDIERESVAAARANARANRVELEVRRLDLRLQALPWLDAGAAAGARAAAGAGATDGAALAAGAPVVAGAGAGVAPPGGVAVVANLLHGLLLELARSISSPPSDLIAGGLLRAQADDVAAAFARELGLREYARRTSGEWLALWLRAP